MITYKWSFLDIYADGDSINRCRYKLSATDDQNTVETEGYWDFTPNSQPAPTNQLTEQLMANWIEKDSTKEEDNPIKSRLIEQLEALKSSQKIEAPWKAKTFKLGI